MEIRNNGTSSSIDSNSGFCSETQIYHSLRPQVPLPPETTPLSITRYIFSLLENSASRESTASAAALVDAATRRRVSHSELVDRVKSLADSLQRRIGLSKGDSAFILSPNSIHLPILYLSLFSIGVIVSPSNPTSSASEISRQIELCKPAIAFATSSTAHKLPSLRHPTVLLDSTGFDSMTTGPVQDIHHPVEVSQSEPAAILYSSGTTGRTKGVVLTHRNIIAAIAGTVAVRPVRNRTGVTLCTVPLFHVYGLRLCVTAIASGECVVSMERFDLRLMMRAIEEFRVSYVAVAPPVVISMVMKDGDVMNGCDLSSLEVVACGGAPLASAVIGKFNNRFPTVQLAQAYGLTETAGGICRTVGPKESQRLGSTGRLLSNCQAKVVDPETGTCLPPFRPGELWVRGPSIMKGYVDDKEASATTLTTEGWLRTGDLCYFDDEGYLFYVERIKELIKYKGYQVAPAELEQLLHSHPDIVDAAVIPYPDDEAGQIPMAFVVTRTASAIKGSQITDFVAKQVAPYKKIRRVSFVNSLPVNAAGKLLRKELVKLALAAGVSKL